MFDKLQFVAASIHDKLKFIEHRVPPLIQPGGTIT
jgi:hypothetical protein